ncbi:HDOD domain-containing protein [Tissierella sp. MB52-C2]|uniref:HDOD domain-containing protein n=1 Tax=Tissierella sp. MB52-C2 TaxID=3070999 RepID=UPI00280B6596|nr:HDOD domain-containing protein [Tissierella sp. MB52-C2]WMM24166.1 HDOD domain-containing protein [Tissierella sp. MB52-C2]
MTKLTLEYIVNKVDDMKALPEIINKLIALTDDPDSTVQDMEKVILQDQVLTTKILRLANSAYYGYARKISTVSQATILLGFQAIKGIALASTVRTYLVDELRGYSLDKNELWSQSQTCAIISRFIAKSIKYSNPEEAYIAGLLRDIGKTVLNQHMEKEYMKVLSKMEENKISFLDAEKEVLGFGHTEIGEKIAEKWDFPKELVEAICYHHTPELANINPLLVSIVHIADAITMMMGIGLGLDGLSYNLSSVAIDKLSLDETQFQTIISQVADLVIDEESFLVT